MIKTELGWVKCSHCGVTRPLKDLGSCGRPAKHPPYAVTWEHYCLDASRCAIDAAELAHRLAEFARLHPEPKVHTGPTMRHDGRCNDLNCCPGDVVVGKPITVWTAKQRAKAGK